MQTFRRVTSFLLPALLQAGCQKQATDLFGQRDKDVDRIDCAVAGASDFTRVCMIDRADGADGLVLTIRHPDGGFRRLRVTSDGRGVVAADGSEAAAVGLAGDSQIEVTLGRDRYRLPATIKRQGA